MTISTDAALVQTAMTNLVGVIKTRLAGKSDTGHTHAYSDLTGKPTLGTAAALDVPVTGNATTAQVVLGSDARLTDARTPTAHNHTLSIGNGTAVQMSVGTGERLDFVQGTNVTIAYDDVSNRLTFSAADAVTSAARLTTVRTIAGVSFDGSADIAIPFSGLTGTPTTLSGYGITDAVSSSLLGANGGVATLGVDGKVPAVQLPSYVDDVTEALTFTSLPATGETGKIYVTLDTNKTYRWGGSVYVEISPSPGSTDSVTEGSSNLYFTAGRARASVSATNGLSYDSANGTFSGAALQTDISALSAAFADLASSINTATGSL